MPENSSYNTTHGKLVARLSKLETSHQDGLENLDWVRNSHGGKPKGLPANQRIKPSPEKSLSDMLLEDSE